jgi:hypothetical protein
MQVPDNITATDLSKFELQVVRGLLSGDIPAREATAVAQILNLLHRNLPTADLEKRITFLEEALISRPANGNEHDVAENDAQDSRSHGLAFLIQVQRRRPIPKMIMIKEDKDEDP